ncbi:MAG: amidohydrolase family protein [Candidatus Humimicrobiaceae bacterium]
MDNLNLIENVIDCNAWFGNDIFNDELSAGKKELENHINSLKEEAKKTQVFLTNYYSLKYDPFEGDIETEKIISSGQADYLGNLVFPSFFVLERNNFEKYLYEKYRSGFKILRFFPKNHKYNFDLWALRYFFEILEEHSFPIMVNIEELDITGNKDINWRILYEISSKFNRIPLIIEGGNSKEMMFTGYLTQLLGECKNLFLTVHNLLAFDQIEEISEKFASRLLFDSYFPYYQEKMVLGRIKAARINETDRKKILGKNISGILSRIIF